MTAETLLQQLPPWLSLDCHDCRESPAAAVIGPRSIAWHVPDTPFALCRRKGGCGSDLCAHLLQELCVNVSVTLPFLQIALMRPRAPVTPQLMPGLDCTRKFRDVWAYCNDSSICRWYVQTSVILEMQHGARSHCMLRTGFCAECSGMGAEFCRALAACLEGCC